jgi:hypothetical protein
MLEMIELWRSPQTFQLVSRESYFGHILRVIVAYPFTGRR